MEEAYIALSHYLSIYLSARARVPGHLLCAAAVLPLAPARGRGSPHASLAAARVQVGEGHRNQSSPIMQIESIKQKYFNLYLKLDANPQRSSSSALPVVRKSTILTLLYSSVLQLTTVVSCSICFFLTSICWDGKSSANQILKQSILYNGLL